MPITNINEFLSFYDKFSQAEIDAMLDEFAPDDSCENIVYAEDFLQCIDAQATIKKNTNSPTQNA